MQGGAGRREASAAYHAVSTRTIVSAHALVNGTPAGDTVRVNHVSNPYSCRVPTVLQSRVIRRVLQIHQTYQRAVDRRCSRTAQQGLQSGRCSHDVLELAPNLAPYDS